MGTDDGGGASVTIREFRKFKWCYRQRMKYAEKDTASYDIVTVDYENQVIEVKDGEFIEPIPIGMINVILNPDGTVAWRAK